MQFDFTVPHVTREEIQGILLGMKPIKLEYYQRALVHHSLYDHIKYVLDKGEPVCSYYVHGKEPASNERLEFLGDSVLELVISTYLFEKFPTKDEGFLSRLRTKIVRGTHCIKFSKLIGIDKYVLTNSVVKGEVEKHNEKILEDAFEAFLGAIHIDLGYSFVSEYMTKILDKFVDLNKLMEDDNYKDILIRYTNSKNISFPIYKTSRKGLRYYSDTYLLIDQKEFKMGSGYGNTKKEAEQNAAKNTLYKINDRDLQKI